MSHAVSSCIFTLLFQLNTNILSVESDVALCATADTLCRVTIGPTPRNSERPEPQGKTTFLNVEYSTKVLSTLLES